MVKFLLLPTWAGFNKSVINSLGLKEGLFKYENNLRDRLLVYQMSAYNFCFPQSVFSNQNLGVSAYTDTYRTEYKGELFHKSTLEREAQFNSIITSKYKYGSSASSGFQTEQ